MIYDSATHSLLTLLERKLAEYGRHDAQGNSAKRAKAKIQINQLVVRIKKSSYTTFPGYVREIE